MPRTHGTRDAMLPSDFRTTFAPAFALLATLYILGWMKRKKSGLDHIPTIPASGIFSSRFGSIKTLIDGHKLVQEGYQKYRIFKIPRYFSWLVIVSGHEYLEDFRKATEDQLSFRDALNLSTQVEYTISPSLLADYFHINAIRGPLTKSVTARFPSLLDELDKALDDLLGGADKDWVSLTCYSSVVHIVSRINARFFVGPELSSDRTYTRIMSEYPEHVAKSGVFLRHLPEWLKPIVARKLLDTEGKVRKIEDYLRPIINEHLEKASDLAVDDDSHNLITWMWKAAPENRRTVHDFASRMIFINLAAVHSTAILLSHVLFNLATYTSYIEPLREEILAVIKEEGWNKIALEKMRKLDSFIKESQRVNVCAPVGVLRSAKNDFTFSDGTFIPQGTALAVAERQTNQDNQIYDSPRKFDGFRFVDRDPLKWQVTAINDDFIAFGTGRSACPGRFFAIIEVKATVCRILLDYHIKLTNEEHGRPKDVRIMGLFRSPNKEGRISLRKRRI